MENGKGNEIYVRNSDAVQRLERQVIGMCDPTGRRSAPIVIRVPANDRRELGGFFRQIVEKIRLNANTKIVGARNRVELADIMREADVGKPDYQAVAIAGGDRIPYNMQEVIRMHTRPKLFIVATEKTPEALCEERAWTRPFRALFQPKSHPLYWPSIEERKSDWLDLFETGKNLILEERKHQSGRRQSGILIRQLQLNGEAIEFLLRMPVRAEEGTALLFNLAREAVNLAFEQQTELIGAALLSSALKALDERKNRKQRTSDLAAAS